MTLTVIEQLVLNQQPAPALIAPVAVEPLQIAQEIENHVPGTNRKPVVVPAEIREVAPGAA